MLGIGAFEQSTPSSAGDRMRPHWERRRLGLRCLTAQLRETEIDDLVRNGLLKEDARSKARRQRILALVVRYWGGGKRGGESGWRVATRPYRRIIVADRKPLASYRAIQGALARGLLRCVTPLSGDPTHTRQPAESQRSPFATL
jgi:hypothetical protein